jgi:hypothetical protein
MILFITTAVKTSNPTYDFFVSGFQLIILKRHIFNLSLQMQPSRLSPTLNVVFNVLTVNWMLTCTSCSEINFVRSGLGLMEVPTCLQEDLIKLDLSNNSIMAVKRDDLGKLKKAKIIDLSYNEIERVHEDAFKHVGNLEELNLSHNNIFNLAPNIFHSNKKLAKVDLSNNKLQVTRNFQRTEHILESTSLTYLDISFCKITSVSRETFGGLPNLETLKMNGNSLIQHDVEFIEPLKNLKIMQIQFFNSSTIETFCNHLINDRKLTLSTPCFSASTNRLTDHDEADLNILTTGTIMCACAFLITVIVYLLVTRCKTRKANAVDGKEHDSENIIQRRQLPRPPEPNEGYEIPVSSRYGWVSSIYRNRREKRKPGYSSAPLANNKHDSRRTDSDKDHVLTGTIPGSLHSLSCTTDYQDGVLYPTTSQVCSHSESNEDEEKLMTSPTIETSSVPKIPQLPKKYLLSRMNNTSNAEGLSESTPRPNQMIGSASPDTNSECQNVSLPLVPPRPTCIFETPLIHNTKASVNGQERMFVSSAFIEIGQDSGPTVQIHSTMDDTKKIFTEPRPPSCSSHNF